MRSNQRTVTFSRPFVLSALDGQQPPGTYLVVTEEEPIEGVSFTAYRRTARMFHLPADPAPCETTQVVQLFGEEVDVALAADGAAFREERALPQPPVPGPPVQARVSIGVRLRKGVWQVMRDRRFYGDYLTQRDALLAANGLAGTARNAGIQVDVDLDKESPHHS